MASIEILNPELADEQAPAGLRPARRPGLDGSARLTLIDNGKPRARQLLLMIAEELRQRGAAGSVQVISKSAASSTIESTQAARIAAESDAAIAGLGDCGACSACSLADAIRLEAAGLPATVLISDVFVAHIASFAVTLGMPGYHAAVVPHPVSSKNDTQLSAFAAGVADQVLAQLGGLAAASKAAS